MIRPPPLQLKYDNRFPIYARTPSKPQPSSFVEQLYKANWKNVVIAVAGLNGLRYAFAIFNAIVDATIDDEEVFENLFKVSFALAVIYLVAFCIEVYGIASLVTQRLSLIRSYLYLTFFASVLVTSAGTLQGVSYFLFAEEIVLECSSLAMQGRGYEKSLFRSRPWPNTIFHLQKIEARKHCSYAWVHQSWSQVASVFLFFLIPSVIYYLLVFTYYRQTIDPNHHANLQHTRSTPVHARTSRRPNNDASQRREGRVYPGVGYLRLGNNAAGGSSGSSDNDVVSRSTNNDNGQGLTTSRLRAIPACSRQSVRGHGGGGGNVVAGLDANANANASKSNPFATKGIKRSRRPPPLIPSPSPLGFTWTPGAPAYDVGGVGVGGGGAGGRGGAGGGRSRVYAAFAAPVGSAGYDKFV